MAKDDPVSRAMKFLGIVLGGLIGCMILALLLAQVPDGVGYAGLGITILFASSAVGALLGFLFAVPRVYASAGAETGAAPASVDRDGGGKPLLQTNTNLNSISDWLTTMLVGVGLSQLLNINDGLVMFRDTVARHVQCTGAAGCAALPIAAPMLLIFGAVAGFLFMYLYTRIELINPLRIAEEGLSRQAQRAVAGAVQAAVQDAQKSALESGGDPNAAPLPPPPAVTPGAVSVDDAIDVMFDLLYRPGGYRQVITLSDSLAATPASARADYWFYRAAAFGQLYAACVMAEDGQGMATAREKALDAARRAARIEPSYRDRLWFISNPAGPDDDLSGLREDAEFRRIVGR